MFIIPQQVRRFAGRLTEFAGSLNISLTNDQALDITGHLWSDSFVSAVEKPDADEWHCVLWNRDAAATGEPYNLAATEAAALASVQVHADAESHEIDKVERTEVGLTVWTGDEVYARIEPVDFEDPEPDTRRRMATLVTSLKTWDHQGLERALATLPSWRVETYNESPVCDDDAPITSLRGPRRGEWLPPLSYNQYDLTAEERRAALEQVLLPMWVTPNSLAKLLQQLLAGHESAREAPPLAACQDGLARVLGIASWQTLVSRFRSHITPQVAMQCVIDDTVPPLRFWRGPVDMLASVYDDAVQRKRSGLSPLHVQGGLWLDEYRMALICRSVSRSELKREVATVAGVHPDQFDNPDERNMARKRWLTAELECRVRAEEWSDSGDSLDILWPAADAIKAAQKELEGV
ncbi:hypothetical protein [Paraburkholderia sp. SIMBA_054]|uniref:hypothetical protein n=1 Tax=Paraburkholderia sp. SIMBA_054 TaxID=3085795 RepID=UPI00397AEBB1